MKRRLLSFSIFLLVINIILSGCGSGTSKSTAESASVTVKPSEMPKDMAVVTDTTLDVYKEPSTTSERVTQALYNQGLKVLSIKDNWSNVRAVDGYTGWVKTKSINFDCSSINTSLYKYRIIVTTKVKTISTEFKGSYTAATAVMGAELYSNNVKDGWYEVYLPEGKKGWVDQSGCICISANETIPKTTPIDFIMTANKFAGSTYLWGGLSTYGIDCSGLTYISAKINGVELPRDTQQQVKSGISVKDTKEMKPGDLVFFCSNDNRKNINHVGIYLGNNRYINASASRGSVTINSTDDIFFTTNLVGIRRIF